MFIVMFKYITVGIWNVCRSRKFILKKLTTFLRSASQHEESHSDGDQSGCYIFVILVRISRYDFSHYHHGNNL